MRSRPYAWEKSYPGGVRWDAPLARTTLPELLETAVAAYGSRVAIEYRDHLITFAELGEMALQAGAGLRALGVRPGMQVALYLPNTPYHPAAFFGALKVGARIVHLSPLDAERELAYKLRDSGARILVTTNIGAMPAMAAKLAAAGLLDHVVVGDDTAWGPSPVSTAPIAEFGDQLLSFATLIARGAAARPDDWPRLAIDDIALLQYTGGTTGMPKGAMLSHGNLSAAVSSYNAWYEGQGLLRRGSEKVICVLPLFHIYSLTVILLRYLANGNQVLLRLRFDAEATARDIEVRRATAFLGVPTMWIALVALPGLESRDLSSLSICTSGGAPLPVEIAQRFQRISGRWIVGGWGMTETSPAGTNIPMGCPFRLGLIGQPLPGVYMDVVALDDPRRVLAPGETGEFRITGPNVTSGYWNRPDETASAFVDGMFLTGDIGHMDEAGFFFLVDRKKDMILSGGFNVFPRIIEEAIYEHPDVEEVIVIGIPDAYRGEAAKAFVKLRQGAAPLGLEALRGFLAERVGRHELPSALEIRDALPRTAVGKLSKKILIDEERARLRAAVAG